MKEERKILFASIAFAAVPAIVTGWAVLRYMVLFPYWDDWALVPLLKRVYDGTATFSAFWQQHNEHRILTAQLIHAALALATRWDLRYPALLNFAAACAAWGCLFLLMLREREALGKKNLLWLPAVVSIFVFSFRQYENWNWASELVCFFASLGAAACALLLSSQVFEWKKFFAAVVTGIFASYSFTAGLMVWPMGFFVLCSSAANKKRKALLVWALSGAAVFAFWIYGYTKPEISPALNHDPQVLMNYFFSYLGAVFTSAEKEAFKYGLLGFGFYAFFLSALFFCSTCPKREWAAFAAPGIFALLNGAVTAVGRAGFGVHQAMASRYVTFSYLFWVSLILLLVLAAREAQRRPVLNQCLRVVSLAGLCFGLTSALTAAAVVSSAESFPELRRHQRRVHMAALQLLDAPETANLYPVYPNPENLRPFVQFLKEKKLNIFDPSQEARLRKRAGRVFFDAVKVEPAEPQEGPARTILSL